MVIFETYRMYLFLSNEWKFISGLEPQLKIRPDDPCLKRVAIRLGAPPHALATSSTVLLLVNIGKGIITSSYKLIIKLAKLLWNTVGKDVFKAIDLASIVVMWI